MWFKTLPTKLWLIFVLAATQCVMAADEGDDFSNNLFSDLAPLLALFGDRVTTQFMSQSMGWADNVILAMAPVGIITIIISAIRVSGHSWLKAVVGRACENLAVAEAELMSSTSDEVCELWNGKEVVRCMGAAPVVEFICLLPDKLTDDGRALDIDVLPLSKAVEEGYLDDINTSSTRSDEEAKGRPPRPQTPPQKISIIRNLDNGSPNISLNAHPLAKRMELYIVAAIGAFLQVGIVVYAAIATYHPCLRFTKDG
ncbi:ankyrin repeat protein [Colletotrichum asianum]